jgi:putative ABC transport system permease protein
MPVEDIINNLTGAMDPGRTGFMISDVRKSAERAADEGVDFSMLFLGLSFFIIISCIVLFSLAVTVFFDSRKKQITVFYNLGFKNRFIKKMLFTEVTSLSVIGAIPGVFLGYLVNILIIKALNSVWTGAVQTDTLSAGFSILPLVYGFLAAVLISMVLVIIKTRSFLSNLARPETGELITHSSKSNMLFLLFSILASIIILISAQVIKDFSTPLFFAAGSLLFVAMVSLLRYYYIRKAKDSNDISGLKNSFSKQFYFFNPSHAVTPVIFIAAGIFAVIITGANRQFISDKMLLPSGGTGGYLLWAESAVPVKEDLNGPGGRTEFGLDEEELKDLVFVQSARLSGDDASCLNLNHVSSPPILAVDPFALIAKGSFSFATKIRNNQDVNPWSLLDTSSGSNTIYGIADQTVLQWGLKRKAGDTLIYKAENGQPLNIIICAGLKSSIFQGYLLISEKYFGEYFPSIPGSSVFLIDGKTEFSDFYRNTLNERLSGYGFSAQDAGEKLSSFFQVTNTYINVFAVLGAMGMILGAAGLGFVMLRNFNLRKREFALMSATGFTEGRIRNLILKDQILILLWGVLTGTISGLTATLPSLRSGSEMPWSVILLMIISIIAIGLISLRLSVRSIRSSSLVSQLRKE